MKEVEFGHETSSDDLMSSRVNLPPDRSQEFGEAAADGQMGGIMKRYFWSNGYAWGTFDIKPKV